MLCIKERNAALITLQEMRKCITGGIREKHSKCIFVYFQYINVKTFKETSDVFAN